MCGFFFWAASVLYRCSNFPLQKEVEDYIASLAIAVSSTSTITTLLNVSIKWIEVASKEMRWITKEQMVKSSHFLIFIEISFVVTAILCMIVAHSYTATAILSLIMCVLIAASFWKGATMVCKKLEIHEVRRVNWRKNPHEVVHVLEQKSNSAPTNNLSKKKMVRPKIFRKPIRKIHPGSNSGFMTSTRARVDGQVTQVSYPASEGAIAIMATAKAITRCCCGYFVSAGTYTMLEDSLRLRVLAAVSIVGMFSFGMFVHLIILHYVMHSKNLSFRSAHKLSTEAFQNLKYRARSLNQGAGQILQRVTQNN